MPVTLRHGRKSVRLYLEVKQIEQRQGGSQSKNDGRAQKESQASC